MKALISGQAGIAVLANGSQHWSVSVAEPDQRIPCAPEEFHLRFSGADDVASAEGDEDAIIAQLEEAWQLDRALQMTLILLGKQKDDDIRKMAAECLEEFLESDSVLAHVLNRLHEAPMTYDADLGQAIEIAGAIGCKKVQSMLVETQDRQPSIRLVCRAFDAIDEQHFDSDRYASKAGARRWFSHRGVFRRLAAGHGSSIGNEIMGLLLDPEIGRVSGIKQLLPRWAAPLKTPSPQMDYSEDASSPSSRKPKQRVSKQQVRSPHERKQLAERQLEEILSLLDHGEETKARNWAVDLFHRQTEADGAEYGVMSMSNLARQMKDRGRFRLQLHFAQLAADSEAADAQAFSQLADALLRNGDPVSALRKYDETIAKFGENVVPRCGRAEVLRELNRYEKVLQQYDQTIAKFSEDVVARCGRAEVLRELNRYEEALQQYDQTIVRFDADVVARNGRAEVLRELNRFEEALQQYDETIAKFSESVVARCGRAEVLRELNRYEKALQQYDQTIAKFNTDVVARNGRAEVLRELNRYEEALQQYDQTVAKFNGDRVAQNGRAVLLMRLGRYEEALSQLGPISTVTRHDWIDHHVRGMIRLAQGDFARAAEIFETGIASCPIAKSISYFRSALALTHIRSKNAARALQAIEQESGKMAEIFRLHAYGEQGDRPQCQQAHSNVATDADGKIQELAGLLFEGYLSEQAASVRTRQWEDDVFQREAGLLIMHAA
ncbi:MAG: tetratricopeptide repeat protein [Planctomycetota bacterium]